MHIAIIRQRYTPFGGAERFIENALNTMQRAEDVKLTIIARSWEGADNPNVNKIICNPFYIGRLWRDFSFARAVCKLIKQHDFDIVQSHERVPCGDIYRAGDGVHREWLKKRKTILPWWRYWLLWFAPYHRYIMWQEQRVFSKVKAIIANSSLVKKNLIDNYAVSSSKIHTIYNSVSLKKYNPDNRKKFREGVLQELSISVDSKVLLFVGSGFARKGLLIALESLALLPDNIHLIVVGNDKQQGRYVKITNQLKVEKQVHFVGEQKNPVPFYATADLFIFPTIYDPFPNAVLEAMASGLPVLLSDQCGVKDIVIDGESGYVLDPVVKEQWIESVKNI